MAVPPPPPPALGGPVFGGALLPVPLPPPGQPINKLDKIARVSVCRIWNRSRGKSGYPKTFKNHLAIPLEWEDLR